MNRAELASLTEHPRLYLTSAAGMASVKGEVRTERLQAAIDEVASLADGYVGDADFDELLPGHNAHLRRARRMQSRVITLIAQWALTDDARYAESAAAQLMTIGRWEYWSWITWRRGDPSPEAIFDLSYGENSATLALGYDLLHGFLSEGQRAAIRDIALKRSLRPLIHVLERGEAWWFGKPDTNWNTVCAGGAGMLALAMYDDVDEAPSVLGHVEESIRPYMEALQGTDGGWPEGIGYWNYGMRYAFMYLLSYERATSQPHPLLHADATRATLRFPLDFCPQGVPCSFGDTNEWGPLPFHYAVGWQVGDTALLNSLAAIAEGATPPSKHGHWPNAAETILLPAETGPARSGDDADRAARSEPESGRVGIYQGMGWAHMADQWPRPNLYLSIRGGTTDVPHGHHDLLSFYAVVGDECMVENLTPAEYLDTTFGPRRYEIFEMAAQSKNVPLINGVGLTRPGFVTPETDDYGGYPGIRLDATEAVGNGRDEEPLARFCGRLFVLLDRHAALIVDRIDLWHEGRVEARLHTRADVRTEGATAVLRGKTQTMSGAFAANAEFGLTVGSTLPTTPGDDATVLRWCGPADLGERFWMATLLAPGDVTAAVSLEVADDSAVVRVAAGEWSTALPLTDDLRSPSHRSER